MDHILITAAERVETKSPGVMNIMETKHSVVEDAHVMGTERWEGLDNYDNDSIDEYDSDLGWDSQARDWLHRDPPDDMSWEDEVLAENFEDQTYKENSQDSIDMSIYLQEDIEAEQAEEIIHID